jgi:hypothetical protein
MPSAVLSRPASMVGDRAWWMTDDYLDVVYAVKPLAGARHVGSTEPRLGTVPLRPLTPVTSLGFEVIEFAEEILGVTLYPWQRSLLIRALEVLPNGEYRFRRVIVLVARQQGKTTVASVLAAWWLFVESARRPDRVPPMKFKVVGVAQTLDIAREPWDVVKLWCDPKPETSEDAELAIESLQDATAKVSDTNGKERITARSRAHYEIRAAKNARGKPAARVLMDELREQKDWSGWNAVSQTSKSFWNGMLIGFSNAGDSGAVVLKQQREAGLQDLEQWDEYVEAGVMSAEEYANSHDVSLGLLEWSAPDGCEKNDVDGILAANPSIGYGAMTVQSAIADIRGMTDAGYRTEVLCQWVTVNVDSYISIKDWRPLIRSVEKVAPKILRDGRTVWGVDTSANRSMTWVAGAAETSKGKPFVTVRTRRAGMVWVFDYLEQLAEESGHREVALQERGAPSAELVGELEKRELVVHRLDGAKFAAATGGLSDAVRDKRLLLVDQKPVNLAIEGGVVMDYAQNKAWNRPKSLPIDISGLVAMSEALYALEHLQPPEDKEPAPPPPPARLITRDDDAGRAGEVNLASVPF